MGKRESTHGENIRALARFFRNEHELWPDFRHALFECEDGAALDRLKAALHRWIEDIPHLNPIRHVDGRMQAVHLFHAQDKSVGTAYLEDAMHSLDCLTRQHYVIELENPSRTQWEREVIKSYRDFWPEFEMVGVHAYAQSGVCDERLRTKLKPTWRDRPLPDGVSASELTCGVFLAKALVLELDDSKERARLHDVLIFAARNKYCYEARADGLQWWEIARDIGDWYPESFHLKTKQAVHKAIESHRKRLQERGLSEPERG